MQTRENKRVSKSADKLTVQKYERPSTAKTKPCSDRIIQLALPNLHIVSSVLKDHFNTLSNNHKERLEKLMDEIKTTKISMSQVNFMEKIKGFKDSDKMKIVQVLNEAHGRKDNGENGDSWKEVRLLPVKCSSDSFLTNFTKKQPIFKYDNNSTDSSTITGSFKTNSKKAAEIVNINYRETVYINVEGIQEESEKNPVNKNTKSIQTDQLKSENQRNSCETSKSDITVLYVQPRNAKTPKKRHKLRQLHTLLDQNDFLRENLQRELIKSNCDKGSQPSKSCITTGAENMLIDQMFKFRFVLRVIFQFLLTFSMWLVLYAQNNVRNFLTQVVEANDNYRVKSKICQCLNRMRCNLPRLGKKYFLGESILHREEVPEHLQTVKKRKKYCTKTYHFSNIASILQ